MAKQTLKTVISNDRSKFITLMLEPWGEDYGMNPGDEVEIIGGDADENTYYEISCRDDYIEVYVVPSTSCYPQIYQNGQPIYCGHNRPEEEEVENPIKKFIKTVSRSTAGIIDRRKKRLRIRSNELCDASLNY